MPSTAKPDTPCQGTRQADAAEGKVIEVYRDFEIRAAPDGFLVMGKVHGRLSEARATVDAAYD